MFQNAGFLIFLVVFLQNTMCLAAAWTQGKGSGQVIATTSYYHSADSFEANANSATSETSFSKTEFNPFVEYGLTDDVTIGINPSMQSATFKKNDPNTTIFDFRQCGVFTDTSSSEVTAQMFDAELFLRKRLMDRNNFVFSVQPLIKTPCGVIDNNGLQFIDSTIDIEIRALAGYGFKWTPDMLANIKRPFAGQYHFVSLETAYRKRGNQFSDQIRVDGTAGLRANKDLLFLGQFFSTFSTSDEAVRGIVSNGNLFVEKDDYYGIKAQIAAVRQITSQTSLQLSLFKDVMGKNSGDGGGASLSIWYGF